MKTIGLIGGISWESSLEYYRIINETTKDLLGGLNSSKILMYSFNFKEIDSLQRQDNWNKITRIMIDTAKKLEKLGADLIVICSNTTHKVADDVAKNINIPLLHIVDVTAERIKKDGIHKIGLVGTKYTMEGDLYREKLTTHGLKVMIPEEKERDVLHDIIYNELVVGEIKQKSKAQLKSIIHNLKNRGAEGIILGCTEIPLLIKQEDVDIPVFDTTKIHAKSAVEYIIREIRD